jgi:hypothetical protein
LEEAPEPAWALDETRAVDEEAIPEARSRRLQLRMAADHNHKLSLEERLRMQEIVGIEMTILQMNDFEQ